MPPLRSIKRKDLIRYLKKFGFEGPFSGGKHQIIIKDNLALRIPNPHHGDIGLELLIRILKQAGINRKEWENL